MDFVPPACVNQPRQRPSRSSDVLWGVSLPRSSLLPSLNTSTRPKYNGHLTDQVAIRFVCSVRHVSCVSEARNPTRRSSFDVSTEIDEVEFSMICRRHSMRDVSVFYLSAHPGG
jgi:hypothetical protein